MTTPALFSTASLDVGQGRNARKDAPHALGVRAVGDGGGDELRLAHETLFELAKAVRFEFVEEVRR